MQILEIMKEEDYFKIENGETIQNNLELILENIEIRKKLALGNKRKFI